MTQDAKKPGGGAGGDGDGPIFLVPPMKAAAALPYEAGQPDGWAEGLTKLRRSTRMEAGLAVDIVIGPCPRCGDQISKDVGVQDGIGLLAQPDRIQIVCNCGHAHANAPNGVRGCGAQGFALLSKIPLEAP
jgi:hypothetical protein